MRYTDNLLNTPSLQKVEFQFSTFKVNLHERFLRRICPAKSKNAVTLPHVNKAPWQSQHNDIKTSQHNDIKA
jgi:hypothetical protein